MEKDNKYYILQTLNEIDLILKYSKNISVEDMEGNPVIIDAIVFRMIQMSEHMNYITQDLKMKYSNIDWMSIKGFRNRLVHNYGGVDLKFVFNAITIDVPKLKEDLLGVVKSIN